MLKIFILISAVLLAVVTLTVTANETVMIGRFSAGELTDWQNKSFQGETRYHFDDRTGRQALFADSQGTASGLYREINSTLSDSSV